jgi:dephospho-CoA kinase
VGRVLRVGLTGGIASGKSHVLGRLREAGCRTLDLDAVAHEVMAPGGPAHAPVVLAFGRDVLDALGRIDRKRLGARVFADAAARARLNSIVHPCVRAEEGRRIAALGGEPGTVFVTDAALLVEAGLHLRFDRLVVVHCSEEEQLRRLARRDGLSDEAARARIRAQMPVAEKRAFAHLLVDTSERPEDTDRASIALADVLHALAREAPGPRRLSPVAVASLLAAGPATGPGGLAPVLLLSEIAERGGLEMPRLVGLLGRSGDWYRPPAGWPERPGPETLAAPLVVWTLARRGPDTSLLAGAAASVARATSLDDVAVGDACLYALALLDVIGRDVPPSQLAGRVAELEAAAARWGARPSDRLRALVATQRGNGEDAPLARALLVGAEPGATPVPDVVARACEALDRLSPR